MRKILDKLENLLRTPYSLLFHRCMAEPETAADVNIRRTIAASEEIYAVDSSNGTGRALQCDWLRRYERRHHDGIMDYLNG